MILVSILPSKKIKETQHYEVIYDENLIRKILIMKERDIVKMFNINRKDFKRILRESLMA